MNKSIKSILVSILLLCSTTVFAQGVDIVTLTTMGEGRTQSEAVTNALRNAIEQAFGAFVSSRTDIVNDELIRDEIVSVASGNVQNFNVLSSVALPNGYTAVTVRADVSVTRLTSFVQSRGAEAELAGALFGQTIRLQRLQAENELQVLKNLRTVIGAMLPTAFDYEVRVSNPMANQSGTGASLAYTVTITPNQNFTNIQTILFNTLEEIAMNREEIESYGSSRRTYAIRIAGERKEIYSQVVSNQDTDARRSRGRNQQVTQQTVQQERTVPVILNATLRNRESREIVDDILRQISTARFVCAVNNGLYEIQFKHRIGVTWVYHSREGVIREDFRREHFILVYDGRNSNCRYCCRNYRCTCRTRRFARDVFTFSDGTHISSSSYAGGLGNRNHSRLGHCGVTMMTGLRVGVLRRDIATRNLAQESVSAQITFSRSYSLEELERIQTITVRPIDNTMIIESRAVR